MKKLIILSLFTAVLIITADATSAQKEDVTVQHILQNQSDYQAVESEAGVTFVHKITGASLFLAFNPSGCEKATDCGDTWWDVTCGCQCRWCVIHVANGSFVCKNCSPCPYC